jgi:hypothetical protein
LTSIIGLNLGLVGVNVLQNEANGALFSALQQQNAPGFYRASVIVILLILLYLAVAVLRVYLDQTLRCATRCTNDQLRFPIGKERLGLSKIYPRPRRRFAPRNARDISPPCLCR